MAQGAGSDQVDLAVVGAALVQMVYLEGIAEVAPAVAALRELPHTDEVLRATAEPAGH
jgi:hypothetical protein